MARRLPPLNALRAFEAAGRHLSFKAAAEELSVTPAAVGHQVRALEAQLGRPLFRRLGQGVALTPAGTGLLRGLSDGFDRLALAVAPLMARPRGDLLTVSVAPSLAARWLVPRLEDFREAHPDITVRFDTAMRVVDFETEELDAGLRFVSGGGPGERADRLFAERLAPACSPRLLEGRAPLRSLADLAGLPLLHLAGETSDPSWIDWPRFVAALAVDSFDASAGPSFSQTNTLVTAALAGQGMALLPLHCAVDELEAGLLTCPFGRAHQVVTDYGYYLVSPAGRAEEPQIVAFREWVLTEAQRLEERLSAL